MDDSSLLHKKLLFTREIPLLFKWSKVIILPHDASHAKKPNLVDAHGYQTIVSRKAFAPLEIEKNRMP